MKKLGIIGEFFEFLFTRKKWWLLPMAIFLIIIAGLIMFGESSVIAPLVYPLF